MLWAFSGVLTCCDVEMGTVAGEKCFPRGMGCSLEAIRCPGVSGAQGLKTVLFPEPDAHSGLAYIYCERSLEEEDVEALTLGIAHDCTGPQTLNHLPVQ